jgi:hypothetical protein
MIPKRIRRAAGSLRSGHSCRDAVADAAGHDGDPPRRVPVDRIAGEVADRIGDADDAVLRESIGLFLRRNARREGTGADSAVTFDESADALVTDDAHLRVRTDSSAPGGWNWRQYYLSVSVVGLQLLVLGRFDGPLSLPIDATAVLLVTLTLLLVGFACRRGLRREHAVA